MFKVISTKVKSNIVTLLERICAKKGMSLYTLFQMYCDVTVRYMSDRHNLTPEMERIMTQFEHMEGWGEAFNLADFCTEPEVITALYFIGDKGKKGVRGVMVDRPFFGNVEQDINLQSILERTINYLYPERYKRLRRIAVELGASSLLEMLDILIEDRIKDNELKQYRDEFSDCERSDYGRKPIDHVYKRKKHRSVDTIPSLPIRFSPDDCPDLPELQDDEGEEKNKKG